MSIRNNMRAMLGLEQVEESPAEALEAMSLSETVSLATRAPSANALDAMRRGAGLPAMSDKEKRLYDRTREGAHGAAIDKLLLQQAAERQKTGQAARNAILTALRQSGVTEAERPLVAVLETSLAEASVDPSVRADFNEIADELVRCINSAVHTRNAPADESHWHPIIKSILRAWHKTNGKPAVDLEAKTDEVLSRLLLPAEEQPEPTIRQPEPGDPVALSGGAIFRHRSPAGVLVIP